MLAPHASPQPSYYYRTQPNRLQKAIDFVCTRPPSEVRSQFKHMATLLEQAWPNPRLHHLAVDLAAALYPWPKRWGFIWEWVDILTQAIEVSHSLGRLQDQILFTGHLTDLFSSMGNLNKAIETGKDAIGLAQKADNSQAIAWNCWLVHQALVYTNRVAESDDFLANIEATIPASNLTKGQLETQVLMVFAQTRRFRRIGQLEIAEQLWEPLWSAIENNPNFDPYIHALAHCHYAFLLFNLNQHQQMASHLEQAVAISEKLGDEIQADILRGNLAYAYMCGGKLATARLLLQQVIKQMEHHRLQKEVAEYLGNLAFVNVSSGHLQDAYTYIQRSLEIHRQIGDIAGIMFTQMNQGLIHILIDKTEAGLEDLEPCITFYTNSAPNLQMVAVCELSVCLAYWRLGKQAQGLDLAQKLVQISQDQLASFPYINLFSRRCLALFLPPSEAIPLLHETLKMAQYLHLPLQEAACLVWLAHLNLTTDPKDTFWEQGVYILRQIEALEWVNGRSAANPPFIAMEY